jgi:6-phosphogluconolactonase
MNHFSRLFIILSLTLFGLAAIAQAADSISVYIGTYTGPKSKGIYLSKLDLATGTLSAPTVAAETPSPSFLAIHPDGKFIYAANEVANAPKGFVTAFSINADGSLSQISQQTSGGSGACYVSVDPSGKVAMVANYGSGSIESLPIEADGKLGAPATFDQHKGKGPDARRQEGPHGHCIDADLAGKFVLSCDLGLDEVFVYRLDPATAKLTAIEPGHTAPKSGPRHLAFHPNGKLVYVITEMGCTITGFNYDTQTGGMKEFQTISTLPADFKGNSTCAEIAVHPSGKFVYGSNRGHDSIAAFSIDDAGKLTLIGFTPTQGKDPRSFGIDPTGQFLIAANQSSNNMVVFRIDQKTGQLTPTGSSLELSAPVCVKFLMPK